MNKALIILAIATAVLVHSPAHAEESKAPAGRPDRLQMMKEHLNLTEEQAAKMKVLSEAEKTKYMALREDKTLSDDQKREKAREIGKASMEQIKAILTPEQLAKMQERMKKQMEEREAAAGKKGEPSAERMQALKEHLNLSDDQMQKLKGVMEAEKEKFRAVYEDKSLSEEQKREKMNELRKGNVDRFKGILTPEQEAKMKQMRPGEKSGERKPSDNEERGKNPGQ